MASAEGFDDILRALRAAVPQHLRHRVLHSCTDSPTTLWSQIEAMKDDFPSLQVVSEDPTHGKFRVEHSGKKSVCGALMLRLNCIFAGKAHEGGEYTEPWFGAEEARAAFQTARQEMSLEEATDFFANPPEVSSQAYGRGLAAVCAIGSCELERKAAKGAGERTVGGYHRFPSWPLWRASELLPQAGRGDPHAEGGEGDGNCRQRSRAQRVVSARDDGPLPAAWSA